MQPLLVLPTRRIVLLSHLARQQHVHLALEAHHTLHQPVEARPQRLLATRTSARHKPLLLQHRLALLPRHHQRHVTHRDRVALHDRHDRPHLQLGPVGHEVCVRRASLLVHQQPRVESERVRDIRQVQRPELRIIRRLKRDIDQRRVALKTGQRRRSLVPRHLAAAGQRHQLLVQRPQRRPDLLPPRLRLAIPQARNPVPVLHRTLERPGPAKLHVVSIDALVRHPAPLDPGPRQLQIHNNRQQNHIHLVLLRNPTHRLPQLLEALLHPSVHLPAPLARLAVHRNRRIVLVLVPRR